MLRSKSLFSCLMLVLALSLAACQPVLEPTAQPSPVAASTLPATAAPAATASPTPLPGLTLEMLRNTAYAVDALPSGQAVLVNGEYRQAAAPGSASEIVVQLVDAALGDLNGDGAEDGVALLVVDSGGSGRFYSLYPVLARDGQGSAGVPVFVGDRIQLISLILTPRGIELTALQAGPDDPMCCPSQRVTRSFVFDGNGLVEQVSELAVPGLLNQTWQAVQAMRDAGR